MNNGKPTADAAVLCWPGRLLSADDLRRHLTSQKEIVVAARTIVTPLAWDELRGKGIAVRRDDAATQAAQASGGQAWGYAQETQDVLVGAAIAALEREGVKLIGLPGRAPLEWARAVAQGSGGLIFCSDAGFVCCLANKHKGVRAVAVNSAQQAMRARQALGANLLAVETPGRTVFELRQIIRAAVAPAACPPDVAKTLQELDGHAHR